MSDARIIALIAAGHMVSHFLQLALPPLFPFLKSEFDVSWVAIGLLSAVTYGVSGLMQTVSGFCVDRFGARRVLLAGMALFAGATALAGLATSYWMLLLVAALAGAGNSVFHPADYSMLNASVSATRIARAYSAHGISGSIGWILAPAVVGPVAHFAGWRCALFVAGGLALAATLVITRQTRGLGQIVPRPVHAEREGLRADMRVLFSAPILMTFAYFALLSASMTGIQSFLVPALGMIYGAPITVAATALSIYFFGIATGTFIGGFLADRSARHDLIAAGGVLVAAVLTGVIASGAIAMWLISVVMAVMGLVMGVTGPSRDMLARAATPRGSSGKVFGFVYSGLDLGALVTPPVYGWFLDRGDARGMFALIAAIMLVMIFTVVQVRRRVVLNTPPPTPAPVPGG